MRGERRERVHPTAGPAAVILGGENGALPIIRSLAAGGIGKAIVASERRDDPTFRSRYCSHRLALEPFHLSSDAANVQRLIALSSSLFGRPVLFWGSDREVLFLNRNRRELSRWYRFILPQEDQVEDLVDKGRFASFARRHGLPVPDTLVFNDASELLRRRNDLPYPCTIKPVQPSLWNGDGFRALWGSYKHALRRFEGPSDVATYLSLLPETRHRVVVQRYIDGRDDDLYSFHAYFDDDGGPMGCFLGRKLRTNPMRFGGSTSIETVYNPDLLRFCVDLCVSIGFRGIVKIDLKYDRTTERFLVLEFNPRFNLWERLGAAAGVNLPAIWYHDLAGSGCRPSFSYREGVRWLYAAGDVRSLPDYLRAGEWTIGSWLRTSLGASVYHTHDWRDPLPLLWTLPAFLRRRLRAWRLRMRIGQSAPVPAGVPGSARPVMKMHP